MKNIITWDDFNKFLKTINKHMPSRGEGDTIASQICTATNKLIYKWFNDGDVYDSYNFWLNAMTGNDLSSYANWLHEHAPESREILAGIHRCMTFAEYEELLYDLAETLLNEEYLKDKETPKTGTIYDCEGPYEFNFDDFEDDEEDEHFEDDEEEF